MFRTLFFATICVTSAFAALPAYQYLPCVVYVNDYVSGNCQNPQTTGSDYPTSGMGTTTSPYVQPWSCSYTDETLSYLARVRVNITTPTGTLLSVACNTLKCDLSSPSFDSTQDWLREYSLGSNATCLVNPNSRAIVFVDTDFACNDQGTYNDDTNTCVCQNGWTGDDCTTAPVFTNGASTIIAATTAMLACVLMLVLA
eukprot:TRINITY_DN5956_c0_g1_i1.p2 TRINITY_DN5956_c0_g1~~TRINITY_DN5956_c0_g1_i1.p2  ORF type:complete len:199 (-),score=15.69 TRINITY_DN5956_c0_g1_i1:104-700(-)